MNRNQCDRITTPHFGQQLDKKADSSRWNDYLGWFILILYPEFQIVVDSEETG